MTGALRLQSGHVSGSRWDGPTAVGYLPQNAGWPGQFTVTEFVDYLAWTRGLGSPDRSGQVASAVAAVGLSSSARARLSSLSGGQHRRAMLAQALVGPPALLLLDEPTAGFDAVQRVVFRELVAGLARDRCVVISTHLVEDVESIAQWVTVLNEGRVAFDGAKSELLARGVGPGDDHPTLEAQFLRLVR